MRGTGGTLNLKTMVETGATHLKGECRPKAAFDYPEYISTKRQGFIRVHKRSIALFGIKEVR